MNALFFNFTAEIHISAMCPAVSECMLSCNLYIHTIPYITYITYQTFFFLLDVFKLQKKIFMYNNNEKIVEKCSVHDGFSHPLHSVGQVTWK